VATIGDVLDEFFSPFSQERLWIMPESDEYTKIVLQWQPVIDAVNQIKADAVNHCAFWQTSYKTNPAWQPTKTDVPKPGAYRKFVGSPPGTDPQTCKDAFVIYVTTKTGKTALGIVSPVLGVLPAVQTRNLFTCSIGSFNIYTTAGQIDCAAKKATLNFWMYNNMSRHSFGRFANDPVFSACGMKSQYMWWNWVDSIEWSKGLVNTLPKTVGGRNLW
jgi:hypothetical protein